MACVHFGSWVGLSNGSLLWYATLKYELAINLINRGKVYRQTRAENQKIANTIYLVSPDSRTVQPFLAIFTLSCTGKPEQKTKNSKRHLPGVSG